VSQDLVRAPLYNFCAPQQLTLKIYAFEEDVVDVIWNDFGVKNQVSCHIKIKNAFFVLQNIWVLKHLCDKTKVNEKMKSNDLGLIYVRQQMLVWW
jgi:hypothetical protein